MTDDLLQGIIKYENGQLDHAEVVELFRELYLTGLILHLQGSYHRKLQELIDAGEVP